MNNGRAQSNVDLKMELWSNFEWKDCKIFAAATVIELICVSVLASAFYASISDFIERVLLIVQHIQLN